MLERNIYGVGFNAKGIRGGLMLFMDEKDAKKWADMKSDDPYENKWFIGKVIPKPAGLAEPHGCCEIRNDKLIYTGAIWV